MRPADELREAVEAYLGTLAFAPELGALEESIRYSLESGGKRIRPVLCLAVAEAAGGLVDDALPAAAAIELVHTFSLIHDDLPALDDDVERRGREHVGCVRTGCRAPRRRRATGRGVSPHARLRVVHNRIRARRRDPRDDRRPVPRHHRRRCGSRRAPSSEDGAPLRRCRPDGPRRRSGADAERPAWLAFGEDVGLLFQVVDDLLDGDGYAERLGREPAERLAEEIATRAASVPRRCRGGDSRPPRARRRSRGPHRLRGRRSRPAGYPVSVPNRPGRCALRFVASRRPSLSSLCRPSPAAACSRSCLRPPWPASPRARWRRSTTCAPRTTARRTRGHRRRRAPNGP